MHPIVFSKRENIKVLETSASGISWKHKVYQIVLHKVCIGAWCWSVCDIEASQWNDTKWWQFGVFICRWTSTIQIRHELQSVEFFSKLKILFSRGGILHSAWSDPISTYRLTEGVWGSEKMSMMQLKISLPCCWDFQCKWKKASMKQMAFWMIFKWAVARRRAIFVWIFDASSL